MHLAHEIIVWVALVGAAVLVLLCAIGVMVMKDAYQRVHFIAPPATLSAILVVVACAVDEPQASAWIKAAITAFVLATMNAVVSHATGRAAFVRQHRAWPPPRDVDIEIVRSKKQQGEE